MSGADLLLGERERAQIDQMVVTMARLIEDGDFLAEGIGTFLPTAAYMLAKRTHAPSCTSLCPNGNTLMPGTRTLTLGHDEFETIPRASVWLDYLRINTQTMPAIFMSGKPRFFYYAPRHTPQLFVPRLDFCSGAGHPGEAPGNPQRVTVITNLGVLDSGPGGRLQVRQLHLDAGRQELAAQTGFALDWATDVQVAAPPTAEELRLLDSIDPRGLRFLEALTGAARRQRLRALATEAWPA
jgi:glutaconate CoA-transferase subunit B